MAPELSFTGQQSTTNWGGNEYGSNYSPDSYTNQNDPNSRNSNFRRNNRDTKDLNLDFNWATVPATIGAGVAAASKLANMGNIGGTLGRVAGGVGNIVGNAGKSVINSGGKALEGAAGIGKDVINAGEKGLEGAAKQAVVGPAVGYIGLKMAEEKAAGWLGNQFGKLGEPLGKAVDVIEPSGGLLGKVPEAAGFVVESLENLPKNIYNVLTNASPQNVRTGSNTAVTGGAGAAGAGAAGATGLLPFLDLANQLIQIYYDD